MGLPMEAVYLQVLGQMESSPRRLMVLWPSLPSSIKKIKNYSFLLCRLKGIIY